MSKAYFIPDLTLQGCIESWDLWKTGSETQGKKSNPRTEKIDFMKKILLKSERNLLSEIMQQVVNLDIYGIMHHKMTLQYRQIALPTALSNDMASSLLLINLLATV